jgi:hypothetical protein
MTSVSLRPGLDLPGPAPGQDSGPTRTGASIPASSRADAGIGARRGGVFPVQYAAELVPPYTYPQRLVPVQVTVRWSDGRLTRCLGEAACWNAEAIYCRFQAAGERRPRVGWFPRRQVTPFDPTAQNDATAGPDL